MSLATSNANLLQHRNSLVEDASVVVIGTALMALCAHVSLPLLFSPVPLTLQTFGVMVIALSLGANRGLAVMVLYLIEGASGLPVFSPAGPGGMLQLFGPTGGFLMSYPLAAYVIGRIFEGRQRLPFAYAASLGGEFVLFICGLAWFKQAMHVSLGQAIAMAVVPFIPGEVLKIAAASSAGMRANRWLTRLPQ